MTTTLTNGVVFRNYRGQFCFVVESLIWGWDMNSTGNAMLLIPHPKKSMFLMKLGVFGRFCLVFFFVCFAFKIS